MQAPLRQSPDGAQARDFAGNKSLVIGRAQHMRQLLVVNRGARTTTYLGTD